VGCLISFEGLDGSGKTTQMKLLQALLEQRHIPFICTREPGGTALGIALRQLLLHHPELKITPLAEAFLFQADRAQHFAELVLPALQDGKIVITDRCFDSSIAYQGVARGIGAEQIERLSLLATQGYVPDLTILLDLDPTMVHLRTDEAQNRHDTREPQTHFDKEEMLFHQRLREAFLGLARAHPQRIHVVDAGQTPERIHEQIIQLVEQILW